MNIVGVDIGGTFTDLVGCVDGRIVTAKTSTTPADPTRGVADSLRLAGCALAGLGEVLHGATIAINTVLERKGAATALHHHQRLPRRLRDRPRQPHRGVQPRLPPAEAAGAARSDLRGRRARARRRQRA